jgi:hypothetical protein
VTQRMHVGGDEPSRIQIGTGPALLERAHRTIVAPMN